MRLVSLIYALGVGLAASGAHAFTAPRTDLESMPGNIGARVIRPALAPTSGETLRAFGGGSIKSDALSGAPRILSGGAAMAGFAPLARPTREALIDVARRYVASVDLGVDADALVLNDAATLLAKDVQFLKFRVLRDGLVIQDASLDFRFKRGALAQVANLTFAEAASDLRPALTDLDRRAAAALIAVAVTPAGEAYRVLEAKNSYALVRVASFDVTDTAGARFLVQVEAATGKIFEVRPTTYHLDGEATGDVYSRWYTDTASTRPYRDLNLAFTGGTLTTDANGRFAGAPSGAQPTLDGFAGPRVRINAVTGTKVVQTGQQARDQWNVVFRKPPAAPPAEDKTMAQSMVFFHTNAVIQQAKRYIDSPWFNAQLTANVNLQETCNAHWDGRTINFYSAGGGCANTGLISDVVFHEWGHGLDHNTGGIDDGAYSEGFGDIMSLMMTRSNILGIGFRTDGSPVRDLAPDKVYPRDAGGGPHAEGLIIGSTFYDLFTALSAVHGADRAADLIANYALKTIFTATRYTDVYDALLVVDDDNTDVTDGTPNFCVVNRVFAQHGLATADQGCDLAHVGAVRVDDSEGGDGDLILEPGETAHLWFNARNAAATPVIGLTGVLSVPAASGFSVVEADLAWDDIPARDSRPSRDAAKIEIDAATPCGASTTATLALADGSRTATVTLPLTIGTNVGRAELKRATGLPLAIPDRATVSAPFLVNSTPWQASTTVLAAHLKFSITHTYVGDLVVTLIAPDGTRREIIRGLDASDELSFDQDITALLTGLAGRGTWRLEVADVAAADFGTLVDAELTLTPALFQCD